jgi:hypothetical protein
MTKQFLLNILINNIKTLLSDCHIFQGGSCAQIETKDGEIFNIIVREIKPEEGFRFAVKKYKSRN